jgi:HEAT repeat protein
MIRARNWPGDAKKGHVYLCVFRGRRRGRKVDCNPNRSVCPIEEDFMRALIIGLGFFLAQFLAGQTGLWAQDNAEPSYQGKPLSYWIDTLKVKDSDPRARKRALIALEAIGEPAIPALAVAMQDKDSWVRGGALAALGRIRPATPKAIKALARGLDDEDVVNRGISAAGFRDIGAPAKAAVPALVRALQSGRFMVNWYAAAALGKMGLDAKAAVPALTAVLQDRDQTLAAYAAEALYRISPDDTGPIDKLVHILSDSKDSTARATAAHMLGDIGGSVAKPAIPALIYTLNDAKPNVRLVAARALLFNDKKSKPAVTALIALMKQKDQFIACWAAEALGDGGAADPEVLRALRAAIPANNVASVGAAVSLWRLDRKNGMTVPALIKALQSKDGLTREASTRALASMGPEAKEAVPALEAALEDKNEDLRELAGKALHRIDPVAAAKAGVAKSP